MPIEPPTDSTESMRLVTLLGARITQADRETLIRAIEDAGGRVETTRELGRGPVAAIQLRASGGSGLAARLAALARDRDLDVALDVSTPRRDEVHLVVMDADSTFLQDEVIDLLAARAGRGEEVAAITSAAMAGSLDFAASLRARVALLAGLPASVIDDVRDEVRLSPGARTLVRTLQRDGHRVAIVSGGFTQVLEPLLDPLGVSLVAANDLEVVGGQLSGRVRGEIVDRAGKARALARFAAAEGIPLERTIAVGDGANDLDMIALAGLGVAYRAKPAVAAAADATISMPRLDSVLFLMGYAHEEFVGR